MKLGSVIQPSSPASGRGPALRQFGLLALCLMALLAVLFHQVIHADKTVASNDGPLGMISAKCTDLPSGFLGYWVDLNWLGLPGPSAVPNATQVLATVCSKLLFSKIYAPFAALFVGLCAWVCFRRWKLSSLACLLGGLAVGLNSDFFSTACWGVASQPISFGFDFLALAALAEESGPRRWIGVILAGMAVGLGVTEGADIGAIFSVFVAAYVLYQALTREEGLGKRLACGATRLTLVAVFAGIIAAGTLSTLIGTQVQGVAGMEQDAATKARRWDEATMWSLPKSETLSLAVPGLFGFRMNTPNNIAAEDWFVGGNYWGEIGRDPAWDRYFASGKQGSAPVGYQTRQSGGGIYAGVLVLLVGLWALAQSLRKESPVFTHRQKQFIWFWGGVGFLSLLLAYGRHAPFYQFFYALPYTSMMRNPAKFVHVVSWAIVILFGFGLHGLTRLYMEKTEATAQGCRSQLRAWWEKASRFDKNWVIGSAVALAVSVAAWLVYGASRERLTAHLKEIDFDAAGANAVFGFSLRQGAWFICLLAVAIGLLILVMSGYFNGRRARLGGILLGLFLVADLMLANIPWVVIWNWKEKYETVQTNPIIKLLQDKPYEHRVAMMPFPEPGPYPWFAQLYGEEWKQHHFPYYNIQTLDIIMMPRPPVDYIPFEQALFTDGAPQTIHRIVRRWQLTNTRYLLGPYGPGAVEQINQQIDPGQRRFRLVAGFDLALKSGYQPQDLAKDHLERIGAVLNPEGHYALYEFTGALPRAKLYTHWQVSTNDQTTLNQMASAAFDPAQTVLVAKAPAAASSANQNSGTVEFTSYAPKQIKLQAKTEATAVLLLNDHFDPHWQVSVDGKPAPLLRCNYLMRGVLVPAGTHQVEFQFVQSLTGLYISLSGVVLGLALLGFLAFSKPSKEVIPGPSTDAEALKR